MVASHTTPSHGPGAQAPVLVSAAVQAQRVPTPALALDHEDRDRAAMAGQALMPYHPPRRILQFLACGERRAIGGWGGLSFEGGWVWRWKDQIDRAFVARHAT